MGDNVKDLEVAVAITRREYEDAMAFLSRGWDCSDAPRLYEEAKRCQDAYKAAQGALNRAVAACATK